MRTDPPPLHRTRTQMLLDRRALSGVGVALLALALYFLLELSGGKKDAPLARLGEMPSAPAQGVMDYDQFMRSLGLMESEPGAKAFAQSFMAQPELAEEWSELQKDKDLESFSENVKEAPAFQRVVRAHSADPVFKRLVARALKLIPGLSGMLASGGSISLVMGQLPSEEPRTGASKEPEAAGDRRARGDAGRALRTPQGRRAPTTLQAFAGRGAAGGGGAGLSASPAAGFAAAQESRQRGASGGAAELQSAAVSLAAGTHAGGIAAGSEAHATLKLASLSAATSDRMQRLLELFPWLAGLSAEERESLLALVDQHGLWGACFAAKMYQRCRDACAASSGQCVVVEGWRSCLDFQNNDAAACRALCPQQPGCAAPGGGPGGGSGGGGQQAGGDDASNGTEWRTGDDGQERKAGDYGFRNWEEADKQGFKPPD